jgi:hypothetical protein
VWEERILQTIELSLTEGPVAPGVACVFVKATDGLDAIDPVPLSDPRIAPPPTELSSLHFNDYYAAFARAEALAAPRLRRSTKPSKQP